MAYLHYLYLPGQREAATIAAKIATEAAVSGITGTCTYVPTYSTYRRSTAAVAVAVGMCRVLTEHTGNRADRYVCVLYWYVGTLLVPWTLASGWIGPLPDLLCPTNKYACTVHT